MPMWNPAAESMPRPQLQKLQGERLAKIVAYAYERQPYYRQKMDDAGVRPEDIRGLEDLHKLPFTTKQDLRDVYPFGNFCIPIEDVVRIHASSGTTGKPTVGGYSQQDLDLWTEVMARTVTSCGVTSEDVAHNAYGYGLFTGGLGFHQGFERIGATVIPVSSGMTRRQIMLMEDFGATVLGCTPSYALAMAEEAGDMGIDFRTRMKVRVGIFGAEPWTEEMRQQIQERMGLKAYDIYGLTEIVGPGVSVECEQQNGMHINEDHFLPEIIDPQTGEQLPYDTEGELVFTTLTKEAMPVIRYRTRDRTVLYGEACACGRTLARMEKIRGRTDDMLIVRGVNVFPSLIEKTLLSIEGLEPHYQIVIDRPKDQLDALEVWVEANHALFEPVEMHRLEQVARSGRSRVGADVGRAGRSQADGPQLDRTLHRQSRPRGR